MDEKENKLNEELAAENKNETAEAQQPQESETSLEEKDGVKYETNDNWKFDAEAPTLNNDMFESIDESAYDIQKNSAQNNKVPEKYVYSNDSDNIVIKREPLTFIPLAVFVAVVIIVLSVLGVRYYTVPNGKEGNLMNPASVAAVVDGNKVSLGMYNLYFSSVVSQYEQYANYGYYDLDTTEDYSKQYTTDEDGNKITWLDYFEQETMNQIKLYNAFYNKAVESGITLTEAQQQSIDEQIDSFKTTASDEGVSLDDYISDVFGDYCTEETVELYMEQFYMSVNYKGKYAAENRPDDEEIAAYYEEHQNDYYQINFSYLATTYDTTSEETKEESEKLIQDYMSKITDRQSIIDLVPTAYADYIEQDTQSYMESDSSITEEEAKEQALATYEANVDGTIYGTDKPFGDDINDWLFDENEPTGQVKYYINDETGYAYIILKTEQPTRIEDETYSVRHILIMPEADESQTDSTTGETEYTDEQWAAAEEKAQSILDEFNSGDKTEYSFALLAEANSEDTASTTAGSSDAFGGLYEGVGLGEMVTEFEEWATDDSRKYGDTGIVKSDYGYHIMFFIDDCPSYESQIITDIRNAKFDEIAENADIEIHDSVVDKANEKFLNEKRAGNSSDTSSSDTASAN